MFTGSVGMGSVSFVILEKSFRRIALGLLS